MNNSQKMNYLIIDAEKKCSAKGHDMNWQRYSDYKAEAECIRCEARVSIIHIDIANRAIFTNCI